MEDHNTSIEEELQEEEVEELIPSKARKRARAENSSCDDMSRCEIDVCPICFEPWTDVGNHRICCLPCGHIYGMSCIQKWLITSGKCPQCQSVCTLTDIRLLYATRLCIIDEKSHELRKIPHLLVHTSSCKVGQCQVPDCKKVKGLFRHAMKCKIRFSGGCALCKKMLDLLLLHARACKDNPCRVPSCRYMRERLRRR